MDRRIDRFVPRAPSVSRWCRARGIDSVACARTLAEHGADVLHIACPNLPSPPRFILDTGHGKLSAHLDLEQPAAVEQLRGLVRETDVFSGVVGPAHWRSGALARIELVTLWPGLRYVAINC